MVPNTNRPRLATLRLNLTTEVELLIPNLILRSSLILHAAAALHCKTTGIFHAARRCWSNRVRCTATISNYFYNKTAVYEKTINVFPKKFCLT